MGFKLFLQSVLLGVLVAAPVGPVGALVIRRTLKAGWLRGLVTGFGSALADTNFALLAILALSPVEAFIHKNSSLIGFIGGGVLLGMGIASLRKTWIGRKELHTVEELAGSRALKLDSALERREAQSQADRSRRHFHRTKKVAVAALTGFLFTVTNPVTVVGFAGAFTAFGFTGGGGRSILIVSGVFVGAFLWWSFLVKIFHGVGKRLSNRLILRIDYAAAGLILISGLVLLGEAALSRFHGLRH